MTPLPSAQLLTIKQAQEVLQVSRGTIYNLIHQGHLTPVKIGHATRVRKLELDRFVNGKRAGTGN